VESILIPALTILVALVMVSTLQYPSFKKWNTETVKPWQLVLVVMVVFLVVYAAELTAFLLLTFYLLWGLVHSATRKGADRLRGRAAH
jgi:phosphatidylserine synthase